MSKLFTLFALLCVLAITVKADHYAVLVAGSNYFYNYRHQADVLHAYNVLKSYGIPADNIITMAYDDIANDPQNPFPGQIFNKPATGEGKDVYAGAVIDYKGEAVTPENFQKILVGDTSAGGKVLKSTSEDNVFIFFSDHGATGLIAFPDEYLYATDFIKTLKSMNEKKMYKQMVIYIEACESGSMFSGILPKDLNIYATTASNPSESSWATYCSPLDMVNGKEIGSCLGDLYSVNFVENLESVNPASETLLAQYNIVQKETNLSHVMMYGNTSMNTQEIDEFEGNGESRAALEGEDYDAIAAVGKRASVSSRMVKLAYLQRRHERFNTEETLEALQEEMASINKLDNTFSTLKNKFDLDVTRANDNIDFDCLKERVAIYEDMCGKLSDYGLKYVRYISETCRSKVNVFDYETTLFKECYGI